MGDWRKHTELWLSNEEHDLVDADAAFAQVFAALPVIEPSNGFVQRVTRAAWLARSRRRRAIAVGSLAASVLIAVTAGAVAYGVFGIAGGWLLTTAASVVSRGAVSLVMATMTVVQWWFATARAGNTVAGVMTMPQSAAVLFVLELVGVAALYMLHRLLRGGLLQAELRFRGPGALCF